MPDQKLSVDDILGELELKRAKQENRTPTGDLGQVDDLIREILTERQEAQLQRENRTPTEREQEEMAREIEVQTRRLTREFEAIQNEEPITQPAAEETEAASASFDQEAERTAVPEENRPEEEREDPFLHAGSSLYRSRRSGETVAPHSRAVPFPGGEKGRPVQLPPGLEESEDQSDLADLARRSLSNTQKDMRVQLDSITGHFGNFKMEHVSVEDVALKTEISPSNYREYRNHRNQRIADFSLRGKEASRADAAKEDDVSSEDTETAILPPPENELAQAQEKADRKFQTLPYTHQPEYTSSAQNEEIWDELREEKNRWKTKLMVLGAIGINAVLFSMVQTRGNAIWLFGALPMKPVVYALIHLLLLGGALGMSVRMFRSAAASLSERRPSRDTAVLAAALVCGLVNLVFLILPGGLLTAGAHLFTPLAVAGIFWNTTARYQSAARAVENFRLVSGSEKYAAAAVTNAAAAAQMTQGVADGASVVMKNVRTDFLDGFMTHSFEPDLSDRLLWKLMLGALPAGVVLGVLGFFLTESIYPALSLLAGAAALGCGFLGPLLVTLPLQDTSGVLRYAGGMLSGYTAVEAFSEADCVLLDACDLFSEQSVVLHSMKTFQGKRMDEAILDAASLTAAANSALKHVFLGIVGERRELLRKVDSVQYEDLMGLSAWVAERRVLMGSRELMIHHSIAVPRQEYEDQYRKEGGEIVYLAVEGELCAAFILEFTADPSAARTMSLLEKNGLSAVVRTVDSVVTADLLVQLFGMDPDNIKILPSRLHPAWEEQHRPAAHLPALLADNGSPFGFVVSLIAARKLRHCISLGSVLAWIGAAAGILLLLVMLLMGRLGSFGALQMLLFEEIFLVIYWLYEKNMRL